MWIALFNKSYAVSYDFLWWKFHRNFGKLFCYLCQYANSYWDLDLLDDEMELLALPAHSTESQSFWFWRHFKFRFCNFLRREKLPKFPSPVLVQLDWTIQSALLLISGKVSDFIQEAKILRIPNVLIMQSISGSSYYMIRDIISLTELQCRCIENWDHDIATRAQIIPCEKLHNKHSLKVSDVACDFSVTDTCKQFDVYLLFTKSISERVGPRDNSKEIKGKVF